RDVFAIARGSFEHSYYLAQSCAGICRYGSIPKCGPLGKAFNSVFWSFSMERDLSSLSLYAAYAMQFNTDIGIVLFISCLFNSIISSHLIGFPPPLFSHFSWSRDSMQAYRKSFSTTKMKI